MSDWKNNDTYEIQNGIHLNLVQKFIPLAKEGFLDDYDGCHLKQYGSILNNISNFTLVDCKRWVFYKKYFGETIVTKVILFKRIRIRALHCKIHFRKYR